MPESGREKLGARRLTRPCAESASVMARKIVTRTANINLTLACLRQFSQRFFIRRASHAAFAHDGSHVTGGSYVERGMLRGDRFRGHRHSPKMRDFVGSTLFDGNEIARGEAKIEGGN